MPLDLNIRDFRDRDALALHAVFHSSVHQNAISHYTPAQLDAWAPATVDADRWISRMQSIQPFVAEMGSLIVAYADLQASGYIDHFFVRGGYDHRGIGTLLMKKLLETARSLAIEELFSEVSLSAQPLFLQAGFRIIEAKQVIRSGVAIPNASMRKQLLGFSD
jgi:putative acetyltransferase